VLRPMNGSTAILPRYFFHVMDEHALFDTVGIELPNLEKVRKEAIRTAGQMIGDDEHLWKGNAWRMVVADERNTIVFSVDLIINQH
jgi:hypothetical protein